MAGRVEGKVAFITGAARGQGRSNAVRLAQEGANIIAVDITAQVGSVPYPMSTPEDLAQTVEEVEALERRIVASQADVRDYGALKAALDEGVAQLGRLDIVSANAGINSFGRAGELDETTWQDMIDTNLTGAWHTTKAAIPRLIAGGRGGSIVITSSGLGLKAVQNTAHYTSAKHGLVGLMRTLALELAPRSIRVNTINPGTVNTPMIQNEMTYRPIRPDLENPSRDDAMEAFAGLNALAGGFVLSVVGALTFVAIEKFWFGTVAGNYFLISAGVALGIAATTWTILGLRSVFGNPGLVDGAVIIVLIGNPLSGLTSAPELLPTPWGTAGQYLPPGASASLLRITAFFHGHGGLHPALVLTAWMAVGVALYLLGEGTGQRRRTS